MFLFNVFLESIQDQDVIRDFTNYKIDMMFELQAQVYSYSENLKLKYSVDTNIIDKKWRYYI